ncbi:MAG: TonB-dependent receptor [Bacteroidales bacterium]|nr:TonB-dependent receptor [Bacteroidales bacterium]
MTLPVLLFGQQKVSISLLDQKTSEPVPFAHLCFENLKTGEQSYQITDLEGKAESEIHGPTVLAVSIMGYKTKVDTLRNTAELTIRLEPSYFDMDEVVVTAQMAPKRVDQSIYQVKVLNSKLIAEKGANNLSDLLDGELNLRIAKGGVLGSSMSVNGLSGEHVKILIDGVPVIGRMNGNIDLSQLNLNNVDHIEIVEGPMSVQYGSNALAGAINIISKENTRNKLLASANTYYESVGVYNAGASLMVNKKSHSFSVDGARNFFGGFSLPGNNSRVQDWKPKEQYNADMYYSYKKNNLKFRLDGKYFHETILDKGGVHKTTREVFAQDNYFFTNRLTTKAQLNGKLGEKGNFDLMSSWSGYSRIKNTYSKDLTSLEKLLSSDASVQDTTNFSSLNTRGTYSWQGAKEMLSLQSGMDLNYEKGEGKRIENKVQEMGDYAVFLSAQYRPFNILSIQPGVRFAYNTRYQAPIVPSVNVKLTPYKGTNLRISYVRGFRAPSLKELYLYFVDINHNVRGNPDLKAEYSHNFNASFNYENEWNSNFYGLELTTFSNIVDNQIILVQDSGNIYSYSNNKEFRSLGYNLKLKYSLHPRMTLTLGMSRTGTVSPTSSQEVNFKSYYFSHDYSAEFRYDLFKYGVNISAFYKYNGKYPFYYYNEDVVSIGIMDAYSTLDLSLNKSFLKKNLVLGIGGKNLFNVTVIPMAGATSGAAHTGGAGGDSNVGWGRTFFVSLNYKFGTF